MRKNYPFFYSGAVKFCLPICIVTTFLLCMNSCTVPKQSTYFKTLQKDTTLKGAVLNNYESKIVKGDKLAISVSSLNPAEDAIFNAATIGAGTGGAAATGLSNAPGYTVQQDGTIQLHRIGTIKVEGYTRKELAKQIQMGLLAYTKEPIVQVNYQNHKLTVIGAVNTPIVINMPEEQMSVIDALVLSGDITANGKRDNITIIRENGDEKEVKRINLEDNSIFSSPWYYVKPNDIILVAEDTEKYVKQEKRQKLQNNLSLIASAVSLVVIILSRVIK
jgi:polysaccharide biosynthesis/export protein